MDKQTEATLRAELQTLLEENRLLREQLDFLTGAPDIRAGIKGETLISQAVGGIVTIHSEAHDVTAASGTRIEIKYSRLNRPSLRSASMRWSWNYPLGLKQKKTYDRLVLVGDADGRYREHYVDPASPFVIFDVPMVAVRSLIQADNHLSITTNPLRGGNGTRRTLFEDYQVSLGELTTRYGIRNQKNPKPNQAWLGNRP